MNLDMRCKLQSSFDAIGNWAVGQKRILDVGLGAFRFVSQAVGLSVTQSAPQRCTMAAVQ